MIKFTFAITAFLGSFLFFLIQPLISKFILPYLGGSHSVWVISLSFFQFELLLSYLLVHLLLGKKLKNVNVFTYVIFAIICIFSYKNYESVPLFLGFENINNPTLWHLKLFALSIGLPVLALGTSQISLQRFWQKISNSDPKFIFAYSNLGSFAALILFVAVLEPFYTLKSIFSLWHTTTKIWLALIITIIIITYIREIINQNQQILQENEDIIAKSNDDLNNISLEYLEIQNSNSFQTQIHKQKHENPLKIEQEENTLSNNSQNSFLTLIKSFKKIPNLQEILPILVPSISSTMLLGATSNVINLDIAVFPLFWVITLGIYLLTWVLAYKENTLSLESFENYLPEIFIGAIGLYLISTLGYTIYPLIKAIGFVFFLFIFCMILHIKLRCELQNYTNKITTYYLLITLGGFLGNLIVSIISPYVFLSFWEYMLAILAIAYTLWSGSIEDQNEINFNSKDAVKFAHNYTNSIRLVGILVVSFFILIFYKHLPSSMHYFIVSTALGIYYYYITFSYFVSKATNQIFVLIIISLSIIITEIYGIPGEIKYSKRTQYGIYRVYDQSNVRYLRMGTTIHGCQIISKNKEKSLEPIGYHHKSTPIGQILSQNFENPQKIAVIGLGAGVMAAYANNNLLMDFYELDKECIKIAYEWFSFLPSAKDFVKTIPGDGRIMLRNSSEKYNMIIMDAFSSDAIPVHLITVEAIKEYLNKLDINGIIILHISNRFFDLEPLLIANCEELSLNYCISKVYDDDHDSYIFFSKWFAIGKKEALEYYISKNQLSLWGSVQSCIINSKVRKSKVSPWFDDFSSILTIME